MRSKLGGFLPVALVSVLATCGISAQTPIHPADLTKSTPPSWVEAAAVNEQHIINDDGSFPLRYRIRKVDAKNDVTRDIIESKQGTVARLVERNGQPLTAQEDALERARLTGMLDSPRAFIKHHKRDDAARGYSMDLVREMPRAMIYTYAPDQPQRPNAAGPEVAIDFTPDPHYKPPALVANILTGLQGRLWIDRKSLRVTRIEGRVLHPVDFGWGMLARIYPGGTVEFEQANAGGDRWAYSHLRENITIREMMVKTVQQHTDMDAADFKMLPAPVSYQEAIHILLATPLTLR
ncbi:MAG TPA: hypothetical protein VIJ79_02245 [Acidobacteriaceae bacterium]